MSDTQTNPDTATAPDVESKKFPAGITTLNFSQTVNGQKVNRKVLVQVPQGQSAPLPVVFGFHGKGGKPEMWTNRLKPLINQGKIVGVYPEGYNKGWNMAMQGNGADDVDAAWERFYRYGSDVFLTSAMARSSAAHGEAFVA